MPQIPANFYTRSELQRIIARAGELLRDPASADLAHGLSLLVRGAAFLDGGLADMAGGPHPVNRALDNPQGWEAEWSLCHSGSFHKLGDPRVVVRLWQQRLKRPGHNGQPVPTGRYRVSLGDDEHASHDLHKLRDLADAYLRRFEDVTPELRDWYLERFFTEGQ